MMIRPGTPQDADAIARLVASFQAELTDHPEGLGAEAYMASVSCDAERGYLASSRYAYLVAERGGELLGFIAPARHPPPVPPVRGARTQGQGLARRLWQAATVQADAAGASGHFTVNSSLRAVPVYRAFGFEPAGEVTSMHGISFLPMRLDAA